MKPWYKSKTVWANLIVIVTAFLTGVQQFFPELQAHLSAETYSKILFTVGAVNLGLRTITDSGITK